MRQIIVDISEDELQELRILANKDGLESFTFEDGQHMTTSRWRIALIMNIAFGRALDKCFAMENWGGKPNVKPSGV